MHVPVCVTAGMPVRWFQEPVVSPPNRSFSSHSLICDGAMLLGDLLFLIEHLYFTVPPRMYLLLKGCLEVMLFVSLT